jgi:AcrR family transcriptional regulator
MSVLRSPTVDATKRSYMRADDRRVQILECAREVFASQGYHGASIADVCKAAGIGRGTLYQYFDNKRELFFAVVERLAERVKGVLDGRPSIALLTTQLKAVEAAPPALIVSYCERRLRALLDAVFVDEPSLRLLLREAPRLDGGVDHVVRLVDGVVREHFVADLVAARELGVIDCPDPRLVALFVMGGVEKMVLDALQRDEAIDLDHIVRVATRIQLFGMLSDRTRAAGHASNDTKEEK